MLRPIKRVMSMGKINFVKLGYYGLVSIALVFFYFLYREIFSFVIISGIFAYLLSPLVQLVERYGFSRAGSILMVYLSLTLVFSSSIFVLGPPFIKQAREFGKSVEQYFENNNFKETLLAIEDKGDIGELKNLQFFQKNPDYLNKFSKYFGNINNYIASEDFKESIEKHTKTIESWLLNIPNLLLNYLSSLFLLLTYLILVPIIGFFILKDWFIIKRLAFKLVPNRFFELVIVSIEKIKEIVGTYIRALFLQVLIISTLSSVALSIAGVSNALIIGLMAGFANMIPYLGPYIGIAFALVSVLISAKPMIVMLYVVIGMGSVQILDNVLVYPLIMGKTTQMHPLIILVTVLAGGYAWGIVGMFLSVPVVFLITGMLKVLYKNLRGFEII